MNPRALSVMTSLSIWDMPHLSRQLQREEVVAQLTVMGHTANKRGDVSVTNDCLNLWQKKEGMSTVI